MKTLPTLKTQRLILRPWKEDDLVPFAQLNQDPLVMEFYAHLLSKEESDILAQKIQNDYAYREYGFWAVEVPGVAPFIGYVGLSDWNLDMYFAPCIDIGWRIASEYWGKGYATEAAREVLRFGFEYLQIPEILSMATLHNVRSHRVMQRLGMKTDPKENFEHPKVPKGHPLSWRVLYRLRKEEFDLGKSNLIKSY